MTEPGCFQQKTQSGKKLKEELSLWGGGQESNEHVSSCGKSDKKVNCRVRAGGGFQTRGQWRQPSASKPVTILGSTVDFSGDEGKDGQHQEMVDVGRSALEAGFSRWAETQGRVAPKSPWRIQGRDTMHFP